MSGEKGGQKLWNRTRGSVAARRVFQARSLWQLTSGLLSRQPLEKSEVLWLEPCGSIHTWGMRYAVDVVFVDPQQRVLRVTRNVAPWRIALAPAGTRAALEFRAGEASGIRVGDQLELEASGTR
jgi:uncharacterized membrane protein (UPF0127 family)